MSSNAATSSSSPGDDWLVEAIGQGEFPAPGRHVLRLEEIKKASFGRGPRYLWVWAYAELPEAPTFWRLTTQSWRRSNALGLATALNGGERPRPPFDPRKILVGRKLVARTTQKANGFPDIFGVRPINPESTYAYRLQGKKAENPSGAAGEPAGDAEEGAMTQPARGPNASAV